MSTLASTLDEATQWAEWPTHDSADELAKALEWVVLVNDSWAAERGTLTGGVVEKLRKWIEKLVEKLRDLAQAVLGASFAVTVGTHVSGDRHVLCEPGLGPRGRWPER
jgi:hypothetical protein